MISVNLRMGKSTIIRFPEKPINIVIGNQNYYSIEFISHDISVQTLFEFSTNLFVYTTHNVYGFVLNPRKKIKTTLLSLQIIMRIYFKTL